MSDRSDIRVSLEKKTLEIPYKHDVSGEDKNFGYRLLLDNPDAIKELPELQGEPAMKELIEFINGPNGTFETVRMIHWFSNSEETTSRNLSIGFVFRDRKLFSNYSNCMMYLGNLLKLGLGGTHISDIPVLLEIQPAVFTIEKVQGWIMDLYVSGQGKDEDAAKNRLDTLVSQLQLVFD